MSDIKTVRFIPWMDCILFLKIQNILHSEKVLKAIRDGSDPEELGRIIDVSILELSYEGFENKVIRLDVCEDGTYFVALVDTSVDMSQN